MGLTLPMAHAVLAQSGMAPSAPSAAPAYAPTRRGGGGALKLLFWQGPTQLNPHFSTGTKDAEAARVFYEPLARWDREGELQPVLAERIPSRADGSVAADGRSVVWRLKRGVRWHDGTPFTADDLLFNADYARDPATSATTRGLYEGLTMVKLDSHTVRVKTSAPAPLVPTNLSTFGIVSKACAEGTTTEDFNALKCQGGTGWPCASWPGSSSGSAPPGRAAVTPSSASGCSCSGVNLSSSPCGASRSTVTWISRPAGSSSDT
jgi:ABC-type transport system substrate-binding protein